MTELLTNIRQLVEDSGQTRYAIAKATGVSESQLSRLMAGTAGLSIDSAQLLLDYLGYAIHVKKKRKV
jgi:transcriptional regulator with XRE-family HTH domain